MQRDLLLLTEMIDAAEQAQALADGVTTDDLAADRQRRDALLWNFTVLGEAAGQLSDEVKEQSTGSSPPACGTGSSTATGPSTWTSSTPPPPSNCQSSPPHCAWSSTRKASRPGSPRHDRKRTLRHYAVALRVIGGRWDRGLADGGTEGALHFLGVGLRIDLDYPEAAGDVDAAEPLGYRQVVPRRLLGAERGDIGGVTVAQRALSLLPGIEGASGAA